MNGSVFNAFLSLCSDYGRLGANPQKSGASPLNDLVLQLVAGSFIGVGDLRLYFENDVRFLRQFDTELD